MTKKAVFYVLFAVIIAGWSDDTKLSNSPNSPTISTLKEKYTNSEVVSVKSSNVPKFGKTRPWVGIYEIGEESSQEHLVYYQFTDQASNGRLDLTETKKSRALLKYKAIIKDTAYEVRMVAWVDKKNVTYCTKTITVKPSSAHFLDATKYEAKGGGVIDVTKYGAKGDGVTDDTKAIRVAVQKLSDGGTLYFPMGKFLINSGEIANPKDVGIVISDKVNIKITGESEIKSFIIDAFNGYNYFDGADNERFLGSIVLRDSEKITISHLTLQPKIAFPSDKKSYDGGYSGLNIEGVINLHIHHVVAKKYNYAGVSIQSSPSLTSKNIRVNGCVLSKNRVSGLLLGTAEDVVVEENVFTYNGQPGDGGTGYGFAGVSGTQPVRVLVRNNLAAYNIRKGIDFHAGRDLKIINNRSVGNGLYGINIEGEMLAGTIEIIGNTISGMNPTIAQNIHGLDSRKHKTDRNRPDVENGTTYWNSVFGIFLYFPKELEDRPNVIIKSNVIREFTGESPPNKKEQSYYPIFVYTDGGSPNPRYTISNNRFICGKIKNFFGGRYSASKASIDYSNNKLYYSSVKDPRLIFNMSSVQLNNNIFKQIGAAESYNYWSDGMVSVARSSKKTINNNKWYH